MYLFFRWKPEGETILRRDAEARELGLPESSMFDTPDLPGHRSETSARGKLRGFWAASAGEQLGLEDAGLED